MNTSNKTLGKQGEDHASAYLIKKGYRILERNIYIGGGEIDIVARKEDLIIFIEVKTRKEASYIESLDVLDERKSQQLADCCEEYMTKKNLLSFDYRIDLIYVIISGIGSRIEQFKGII
jgi:putative endonuclease